MRRTSCRATPRSPLTLLAAAAVLTAAMAPAPLGATASATSAAERSHAGHPSDSSHSSQRAPVLDEVDFHFLGARRALGEARTSDAADELRTAAAFVSLEARRCDAADGELEKDLRHTVRTLTRLATRVERGRVTEIAELEQTFLRADHVLARHHARHAEIAWGEGHVETVGRHLCAMAGHLEHAFRWTGERAVLPAAIAESRRLALEMVEGRQGSSGALAQRLEEASAALAVLEPYAAGRIARTEGVVTAYDPGAGTLSIRTRRGRTRTFLTDEASALAGVAEGQQVRLTYATEGRQRTVRTVSTARISGP